jgi:hypothetical protein
MKITKTERLHWRLNPEGRIAFQVDERLRKLRRRQKTLAAVELAAYIAAYMAIPVIMLIVAKLIID